MKIAVFGASGKVGRLLVEELLQAGHEVTAFVHSSDPFKKSSQLTVVKGDIYDAEAVSAAITGSQVAISTLGSWGTKRKDVVSRGVANIIAGMHEHGVSRIITLTGSDAVAPNDEQSLLNRLTRFLITLSPAGKILSDGDLHIKYLAASGLDWTALRSPVMNTRGDYHRYTLTMKRCKPWATVHRKSVVFAIVGQLTDELYHKKAPFIGRD